MSESKIKADKITKPIQLLAVWLIGLIAIETSLLTASGIVTIPDWLPAFYGISAVCIIPLFLILIFLLQTKYRPQIQGDEYYAKYLDKNTMMFVDVPLKSEKPSELIRSDLKKGLEDAQNDIQLLKEKIKKGYSKDDVDSILKASNSKINELQRIVIFSNVNLYINNTLPTYTKIVDSIKTIGFKTFEEFGGKKVPPNFLVSFSDKVSSQLIKDILVELIPLGASKINLIDEEEEERSGIAIFIGSYLFNNKSNITIDQKVLDKLAGITENSALSELIAR